MAKKTNKNIPTDSYDHKSAERSNLATTETANLMEDEDQNPVKFSPTQRELDDQPVLAWQRGGGDRLILSQHNPPSTTLTRSTSAKRFTPERSSIR